MNLGDDIVILETTSTEVKNRILKSHELLRAIDTGALYIGGKDGKPQALIASSTSSSGGVINSVTRLSQAEYAALSPKDPDTLYIINEGSLYLGTTQLGGGGGGGANGVSFTANGLSQLLYLTANGSPLLPGKAISTSYTSNTAIQPDGTSAASAGWSTGELQAVQGGMTYYVDKIRFLAWYTITKTFISLVDIADGAAAQTVIAPNNAAYAKFTVKATNTSTAFFNPGSAANKINNVVLGLEARLPALRSHLIAWTKSEAYQITSTITYNAGGKVDTTGTVNILWPNGATGQIKIFYNADWTVRYYYLTYENDGQRHYITQPTITYNGSQQPTSVPALTVSAG